MRKIILAAVFSLFAWPALAVTCPVTTLQVKDNGNVTANMATGDDGSGAGNCEAAVQLKQGGNTATVTTHGLSVDGSGVTQPVSAASLPLPTGAATSANQATITTWAGGTLGAMANYGTSPGAVLVPGVNANITNTVNAAQAGTWNIGSITTLPALATGANTIGKVDVLGNAGAIFDGATGAAVPANVLYLGVNNGGNLLGWPAKTASSVSSSDVVPEVAVANATPTGQTTMSASSPVTIASDQAGTCTNHAFKHITSATDTLAVQGVTAQTVRICAYVSRAAGTATWFFENTASTNANCSSTLTQINGVATEAANTGEVVTLPLGITLNNTSGNGLCINSTGTGGVDIDFWYAQR